MMKSLTLRISLDIAHRACIKHQANDAISRLPAGGADNSNPHDDIPVLKTTASMFTGGENKQEQ